MLNSCGVLKNCRTIPDPAPMGSYSPHDVVFLLKEIGLHIEEQGNEERERAIQRGTHYSEMLPIEYRPTKEYIDLFHKSLKETGGRLALATAVVAETILKRSGPRVILVSLARAGTPIGVLIKKYLRQFHGVDAPHYSISIIRDKGIDKNALIYLLQRYPGYEIQFIDGWTGKGSITRELSRSISNFEQEFKLNAGCINRDLAVLADPGYCANIFGTRDDFLIPSACLNSTVSGLMSRTVYRDDLIKGLDFHGAKFYAELRGEDLSNYFVDTVAGHLNEAHQRSLMLLEAKPRLGVDNAPAWVGLKEVRAIQLAFGIQNVNHVKPGVGETTRVLLRRVPWKILVRDAAGPDVRHVLLLAEDRKVEVQEYPRMSYSCCGLIKSVGEAE